MKGILAGRKLGIITKLFYGLLLMSLLAWTSGCANRATASLTPGADLTKIKSFYLIPGAEDEDNYKIIQANLEKRGYSVTTGPEMLPPYKSDAVVTYVDRWDWDIITYMIELTITLRDPINNSPIAIGNSLHSVWVHKSPEEMVDEVLTNIFNSTSNSATTASQTK